jgi:hypothetical protein
MAGPLYPFLGVLAHPPPPPPPPPPPLLVDRALDCACACVKRVREARRANRRVQGTRKRRTGTGTGPRFSVLKRAFWDCRFLCCFFFDLGSWSSAWRKKSQKKCARDTGDALLRPACPTPVPLRPAPSRPARMPLRALFLAANSQYILASLISG